MNRRLFAAIRPPGHIVEALVALEGGIAGARWQDAGQLHLTLRFFGEVAAARADDIDAALAQVRCAPFALALRGVGHFDRKGRTHTLWASITRSDALATIQRRTETAARRAGLAPEPRKFIPHVTLARLNAASGPAFPFLANHDGLTGEPWQVSAFDLMESTLTPTGASYETVRRYRLDV